MVSWYAITVLGLVSPLFWPSPLDVWKTFVKLSFADGYKGNYLWVHLGVSLFRIFFAFLLAGLIAIPIGLLCGVNRILKVIVSPLIHFYRPLPPLAYYSLLVIWFGIGDASKIILLFLAGFAPILSHVNLQ